jgi:hypothetical protein
MKPFLQGKKFLAENTLRALSAKPGAQHSPATQPVAAHAGAHVEVIKEGDKVVRLIITCGCGEKTEVDCLYSGRG